MHTLLRQCTDIGRTLPITVCIDTHYRHISHALYIGIDLIFLGILLNVGHQLEEFETNGYDLLSDQAMKWDKLKVLRIDTHEDNLSQNSAVIDIIKRAYNLEQVYCENESNDITGAWKYFYKPLCEISKQRNKINTIRTSRPSFFQHVEDYVTENSLDANEYVWQNLKLELSDIHAGFVKYFLKLRRLVADDFILRFKVEKGDGQKVIEQLKMKDLINIKYKVYEENVVFYNTKKTFNEYEYDLLP